MHYFIVVAPQISPATHKSQIQLAITHITIPIQWSVVRFTFKRTTESLGVWKASFDDLLNNKPYCAVIRTILISQVRIAKFQEDLEIMEAQCNELQYWGDIGELEKYVTRARRLDEKCVRKEPYLYL